MHVVCCCCCRVSTVLAQGIAIIRVHPEPKGSSVYVDHPPHIATEQLQIFDIFVNVVRLVNQRIALLLREPICYQVLGIEKGHDQITVAPYTGSPKHWLTLLYNVLQKLLAVLAAVDA